MKLKVRISGIRGTEFKESIQGAVSVCGTDEKKIIVIDAFEGYGNTYKEREFPEVRIYDEMLKLIFQGTFQELTKIIKDANNTK